MNQLKAKKAPPGTAARGIASVAAKEVAKTKEKDSIIAEDPPQLKKSSRVGIAGRSYAF